jgi:hypothetical protein
VLGGPLVLDLDTPDDLLLAEASLRAIKEAEGSADPVPEPVDVG